MVGASTLVLSGCPAGGDDPGAGSQPAVESVRTDLRGSSCRQEIDMSDPNETPYQVCPGVAGYSLIVRRVDAGRRSIDVVNAEQQAFPLDYQEFVTRHMASLDSSAEWRMASSDGTQLPIALIVRVHAREDMDDPEVTRTWWAVAKISPDQACVTDRILEGERSEAEVRGTADTARERPCLSPQPPITANGAVVR
jgi:hypothetical protein